MKLDSLFEKQAAGSSVAVYARRLSRIWKQLQRSHVPVAIGCSCGAGFNHVKMQDLEQDVLDYLFDKYSRAGVPSLVRALHSFAGYKQGVQGSVTRLLENIADEAKVHPIDAELLICDLMRTIESLDRFSADTST